MQIAFTIVDCFGIHPNLKTPRQWDSSCEAHPLSAPSLLPMMTARRLSSGCRYAVECAMQLSKAQTFDAVVFASRHAEMPRGEKILVNIAKDCDPSPTDFTMSVHNAAAGVFTIQNKLHIPASSVAAGPNTWEAALFEATNFLANGKSRVLIVDYENALPPLLGSRLPPQAQTYAFAMLIKAGEGCSGTSEPIAEQEPSEPDVVQFFRNYLSGCATFSVTSGNRCWHWKCSHDE